MSAKKFLKKMGALALAASVMLGAGVVCVQPAHAAEKLSVKKQKYEKTYQTDDGLDYFTTTVTFPKLKGSSEAVKKINGALETQKETWIAQWEKDAETYKEEWEGMLEALEQDDTMPVWHYSSDVTYKVKTNDGNYFSVLFSGYVFTGGVHGMPDRVGMTFDAKTGEQLDAADLFNLTEEKLNQKVQKLYLNKYDKKGVEAGFYVGDNGREALIKTMQDMNFNTEFFVRDGKAIFYAYPYVMGPYAAGFIQVSAALK